MISGLVTSLKPIFWYKRDETITLNNHYFSISVSNSRDLIPWTLRITTIKETKLCSNNAYIPLEKRNYWMPKHQIFEYNNITIKTASSNKMMLLVLYKDGGNIPNKWCLSIVTQVLYENTDKEC